MARSCIHLYWTGCVIITDIRGGCKVTGTEGAVRRWGPKEVCP